MVDIVILEEPTTKPCSACTKELPKESFSKKQFQQRQQRRCKSCVESDQKIVEESQPVRKAPVAIPQQPTFPGGFRSFEETSSIGDLYNQADLAFNNKEGGIIFYAGNKAIGIEFYGIGIRIQCCFSQKGLIPARNFLRGETFGEVRISSPQMQDLERHLKRSCKTDGLIDLGSGCYLYNGYFRRP